MTGISQTADDVWRKRTLLLQWYRMARWKLQYRHRQPDQTIIRCCTTWLQRRQSIHSIAATNKHRRREARSNSRYHFIFWERKLLASQLILFRFRFSFIEVLARTMSSYWINARDWLRIARNGTQTDTHRDTYRERERESGGCVSRVDNCNHRISAAIIGASPSLLHRARRLSTFIKSMQCADRGPWQLFAAVSQSVSILHRTDRETHGASERVLEWDSR